MILSIIQCNKIKTFEDIVRKDEEDKVRQSKMKTPLMEFPRQYGHPVKTWVICKINILYLSCFSHWQKKPIYTAAVLLESTAEDFLMRATDAVVYLIAKIVTWPGHIDRSHLVSLFFLLLYFIIIRHTLPPKKNHDFKKPIILICTNIISSISTQFSY